MTIATKAGLYPYARADHNSASVWMRKALGKVAPHFSKPEVNWHVSRAKTELRASLRRLKTEFVDALFLHEPQFDLIQAEELQRWLEAERAQGRDTVG